MNRRIAFLLPVVGLAASLLLVRAADEPVKPLRVLLVTGGCCHDYEKQRLILAEGLGARANIEVEFAHNPDKTTKATFENYKNPDWAKGFHDDIKLASYNANRGLLSDAPGIWTVDKPSTQEVPQM
jgi:hypothetical protein